MREVFREFVERYPRNPKRNDGTFRGSSLQQLVTRDLVSSVRDVLGERGKGIYPLASGSPRCGIDPKSTRFGGQDAEQFDCFDSGGSVARR